MIALKKAGTEEVRRVRAQPVQRPARAADDEAAHEGRLTLGNVGDMIRQVTKLWGRKRIWLTEYAYQTNPPDRCSASRTRSRRST